MTWIAWFTFAAKRLSILKNDLRFAHSQFDPNTKNRKKYKVQVSGSSSKSALLIKMTTAEYKDAWSTYMQN
jgi:16S rRNA U516 pseudouridylate synthase RsuA-like enzyme